MASGATSLGPGWVRGEFQCTKAGLRGVPRVLGLTRVLHHDGASLSKLTIVEAAERHAPLAAARGGGKTSALPWGGRGLSGIGLGRRYRSFQERRGSTGVGGMGAGCPEALPAKQGQDSILPPSPRARGSRAGTSSTARCSPGAGSGTGNRRPRGAAGGRYSGPPGGNSGET